MTRLLVSVVSPSGQRVLSMPDDARLEDLLPSVVQECEGTDEAAGWTLAPQGESAIEPGQTLGDVGLFPGAVLLLTAPPRAVAVPAAPRPLRLGAISERDYIRTLDAAIAARKTPPSTVIAVAASRPGAGATTVAALVAMALGALRGEAAVAVDANPGSGALSHWLVPDDALPGGMYRSLFSAGVTPGGVGRALVRAGPRLLVLPAPLDPGALRNADDPGWERLIEHLRRMYNHVVVDCGTRRSVPAWGDFGVLVSKFGQAPAAAPRAGVTVINQAPRAARIRGREVTVQAQPQAAARLRRRGFAWADAPPAWQQAVRELVAVLVGGA